MNTKSCFLTLMLLVSMLVTSCDETKEVGLYDNWRERNEAFIDSLQNVYDTKTDHGGLDTIHLVSDPYGYLFFKKKTAVAPVGQEPVIKDVSPLFTDDVLVFYKGSKIIGSVDAKGNFVGEIFGGNFTESDPSFEFSKQAQLKVNEMITGWTEMLQRMKVGERREIYIPWKYGYGSSNYTNNGVTILGYSTLIFDMQLIDIVEK